MTPICFYLICFVCGSAISLSSGGDGDAWRATESHAKTTGLVIMPVRETEREGRRYYSA